MLRAFEKKMEERRKAIRVEGFAFGDDVAYEIIGKEVISHLGLGGRPWWQVYSMDQKAFIWIHDKGLVGCTLATLSSSGSLRFDKTRLPHSLGIVSHGSLEFGRSLALLQTMCSGYFKAIVPKMTIVEFEGCISFSSDHWGTLHIRQVCDVLASKSI